jgi:hypothetical protein
LLQGVGSIQAEAWKRLPQGLKPSLAPALCGTAEAVPFVQSLFPSLRKCCRSSYTSRHQPGFAIPARNTSLSLGLWSAHPRICLLPCHGDADRFFRRHEMIEALSVRATMVAVWAFLLATRNAPIFGSGYCDWGFGACSLQTAATRRSSVTHPSTCVAILGQPGWSQRYSVSNSSCPSGVVSPVLIVT